MKDPEGFPGQWPQEPGVLLGGRLKRGEKTEAPLTRLLESFTFERRKKTPWVPSHLEPTWRLCAGWQKAPFLSTLYFHLSQTVLVF